MKSIYIIHLSDLHIGSDSSAEAGQMTKALCDKLRSFRDEHAVTFSLLIVSGDLVHKGSGNYRPAKSTLKEICSAAGLGPDFVFIVPGNHDVVRARCDIDIYPLVVKDLKNNPNVLQSLTDKQLKCFDPGFDAFTSFLRSYPLHNKKRFPLPGFYQADCNITEVKVRLCGLNSALVAGPYDDGSKTEDELKNRVPGLNYLVQMIPTDDTILSLVVSHYPLSWLHEMQRDEVRQRLQQARAIFFSGHIHEESAECSGITTMKLLQLGAGSVYGLRWKGKNHCRILELPSDKDKAVLHDWIWFGEFGWRSFDPLEADCAGWARARTSRQAQADLSFFDPKTLMRKCQEVGLIDIRSHRTEGERTRYFESILDRAAPDSDLIIAGRSLIDWASLHQKISETINNKGLKVRLALLDENTVLDPDDSTSSNDISIKSWIEKPIPTDWAMSGVVTSMESFRRIRIDPGSQGSLEIYGLPFYLSHSFVAYTNREDNRRYCAEEVGMGLQPYGRPFVELSSPAASHGEPQGSESYAGALEWMYRSLLTDDRRLLFYDSRGSKSFNTTQREKIIASKVRALGLVDLAIGRERIHWRHVSLLDLINQTPDGEEIFMVGRSLVAWKNDENYKALGNAVRQRRLKCSFVIADPTIPNLKSLVTDYAVLDVPEAWKRFQDEFSKDFYKNDAQDAGYVEIYGIPAYVPVTFASYVSYHLGPYCSLEPGIGMIPAERPIFYFRKVNESGNDIYSKLYFIYDNIRRHSKLILSTRIR